MHPRKFGSLTNHRQEPWKAPLAEFIELCYEKRFKRAQPEKVRTLEDVIKADEARRADKQERKAGTRAGVQAD